MSIWNVLKIKETKNKEAITAAYREELKHTNPEDDQEAFIRLRRAYEEAMELADKIETGEGTKADEIISRLTEIYENLETRIDINVWNELFEDEYFVSLETSNEAKIILLQFLMDHCYIPTTIWRLVVLVTNMREDREDLEQKVDPDFLDYCINNSEYSEVINYGLFDSNESVDDYFSLFSRANAAVNRHELDDIQEMLDQIDAIDNYHPCIEALHARYECVKLRDAHEDGKLDESECEVIKELIDNIEGLNEDVPDQTYILNALADLYVAIDDLDMAKECVEKSIEIDETDIGTKFRLTQILFDMGEYVKSRDMALDMSKDNPYSTGLRSTVVRCNEMIIGQLKEYVEKNPEDTKQRLELGWSCYQNYMFSDVIAALDFTPNDEQYHEYNNLKGRAYLCLKEYEKALVHFFNWKEAIEIIDPNTEDEELKKKQVRLGYCLFLIGDCYKGLRDYTNAHKYIDESLAIPHEEMIQTHECNIELYFEQKLYDATIDACQDCLKYEPVNFVARSYMARAAFAMRDVRLAYDNVNKAIQIYPYAAQPHVLLAKIYNAVDQPEDAKKVIADYEEFGFNSGAILCYKADLMIESLPEKIEDFTEINNYIEMFDSMISAIEEGIPVDVEHDDDAYRYRLKLEKLKNDEESTLKLAEKFAKRKVTDPELMSSLAGVFLNSGKYRKAINYYKQALEIREDYIDYVNLGIVYENQENYKKSLPCFENARRVNAGNPYIRFRLGKALLMNNLPERAYEVYKELFELAIEYEDNKYIIEGAVGAGKSAQRCENQDVYFPLAEEIYKKALEVIPNNARVVEDYAELLVRMNKVEDGLFMLRDYLENKKSDEADHAAVTSILKQLCFLAAHEGDIEQARNAYDLYINIEKSAGPGICTMGRAYYYNKMYKESRDFYLEAIKMIKYNDKLKAYKSDFVAGVMIAEASMKKLSKRTIDKYVKDIDHKDYYKKDVFFACIWGRCLRAMGDYATAIEVLNVALKNHICQHCVYGVCHEALLEMAYVYRDMGDLKKALYYIEKANASCGHCGTYEKELESIRLQIQQKEK